MSSLTIQRRGLTLLRDLSLTLAPGEVLGVTGTSGAGKSSLLKCLAGTLAPTRGRVQRSQRLGFVFQEPRLLPWYSALHNVALFAQRRLMAVFDAEEWLEQVGLGEACELYPSQLSGGMRQRVAIARAMVAGPELLLVDEPFAALDRPLASSLRTMLASLITQQGMAAVWVTHDLAEAAAVSTSRLHLHGPPGRWALE